GFAVRTAHVVLTWLITLILFLHDTGEPEARARAGERAHTRSISTALCVYLWLEPVCVCVCVCACVRAPPVQSCGGRSSRASRASRSSSCCWFWCRCCSTWRCPSWIRASSWLKTLVSSSPCAPSTARRVGAACGATTTTAPGWRTAWASGTTAGSCSTCWCSCWCCCGGCTSPGEHRRRPQPPPPLTLCVCALSTGFQAGGAWRPWLRANGLLLAVALLVALLALVVLLLLGSHLYLISLNTTTWEFMCRHRISYLATAAPTRTPSTGPRPQPVGLLLRVGHGGVGAGVLPGGQRPGVSSPAPPLTHRCVCVCVCVCVCAGWVPRLRL
ncbi:unnamed protein product, partial [Tetraodon nigroviridis]